MRRPGEKAQATPQAQQPLQQQADAGYPSRAPRGNARARQRGQAGGFYPFPPGPLLRDAALRPAPRFPPHPPEAVVPSPGGLTTAVRSCTVFGSVSAMVGPGPGSRLHGSGASGPRLATSADASSREEAGSPRSILGNVVFPPPGRLRGEGGDGATPGDGRENPRKTHGKPRHRAARTHRRSREGVPQPGAESHSSPPRLRSRPPACSPSSAITAVAVVGPRWQWGVRCEDFVGLPCGC